MTRKVTYAAARIKLGFQKKLKMGNLDAERDWGFAGDYVRAMWMMLQRDQPQDYVIATGVTHSVRTLLETAFGYLNLDYREYLETDPELLRPAEVCHLRGDASKAERDLGWKPTLNFEQLIHLMVDEDLALLQNNATPASLRSNMP